MQSLATASARFYPWYRQGGAPLPVQANRFLRKASLAEALVNEVTPGVLDLVEGSRPPTFAKESGALFDTGDDGQYLRTGIFSDDGDVSAFVTFTVHTNAPTCAIFGYYDATAFFCHRITSDGYLQFCNGSYVILVGGGLTNGTHTLCIAGRVAYLDGVAVFGNLFTENPIILELFLGALNYGNMAFQSCGCYITHWAFWDSALSAAQVFDIHARTMLEAGA